LSDERVARLRGQLKSVGVTVADHSLGSNAVAEVPRMIGRQPIDGMPCRAGLRLVQRGDPATASARQLENRP